MDLKHHTGRMYKAMFNSNDQMVATCGSDRLICVWDLRKAAKPVVINNDSESCIMACDWAGDNKHVVSSTIEGVINSLNIETNKFVLKHDTLALTPDVPSNIIYSLKGVKNHPNKKATNLFTVGAENQLVYLCDYDPSAKYEAWLLEIMQKYEGHSYGIRDVQFNHNCTRLLTCCEDHSLRIWDPQT